MSKTTKPKSLVQPTDKASIELSEAELQQVTGGDDKNKAAGTNKTTDKQQYLTITMKEVYIS